jgi:hypothetical protein
MGARVQAMSTRDYKFRYKDLKYKEWDNEKFENGYSE